MSNGTLAPPPIDEAGLRSGVPQPGPSPEKRGLASRLSVGHVLTLIAGILTFFFVLLILAERNDPEVFVVIAAEPVDEGVPLTPDLFEVVTLPEDSALAEGALNTTEELDGRRTAQRDIPDGGVLRASDLKEAAAETPGGGLRSISIPIDPDKAVGGNLRDSDVVDIIAVDGAVVWIPVAGLEVLDTGASGGSLLGGGNNSGGGRSITLAVTADQALAIAQASEVAEVYVVRSTGAVPLPVLSDAIGEDEVGVTRPNLQGGQAGSGFSTSDVGESLNEALGGVLDDIVTEEETD